MVIIYVTPTGLVKLVCTPIYSYSLITLISYSTILIIHLSSVGVSIKMKNHNTKSNVNLQRSSYLHNMVCKLRYLKYTNMFQLCCQ